MHAAAIFVVEAHLAELQREAEIRRATHKPAGASRTARLIGALRESLATRHEPVIPRLEAYPYSK